VGLKPTRGRVSVGPEQGHDFLAQDGVLTRTVAETAALLDVLAGYELGDATWAPPPGASPAIGPAGSAAPLAHAASWAAAAAQDPPAGLRIGLALDPALPAGQLDPMCRAATERTAGWLEELGHHVEPVQMPWAAPGLPGDFLDTLGPLIAAGVDAGGQIAGRAPASSDVEALTWAIYEHSRRLSASDYLAAQNRLERLARETVTFGSRFDLILTPVTAQRPPRTGEIHGRGPEPWDHFGRSGAFLAYTAIVNVTGQPAISLPVYTAADGLPASVQLIGQPAREDLLLSLSAQLERAHPWKQEMLRPASHAAEAAEAAR
jgi:amidase